MANQQSNCEAKEGSLSPLLCDTVHAKAKWLHHVDAPTATSCNGSHIIQVRIKEVRSVLVKWLRNIYQERGDKGSISPADGDFGVRLTVFGGHLLGVATEDSDVDIVCIVPGFVQHDDYFTKFPDFLKEQMDFNQIRVVSGARVPLIECHSDVKLDLLLCTVRDYDTIPHDLDILDDKFLKLLDTTSIYSVNGYRATLTVLQIVPDQDKFVLTLKAVKLWAKCQHVHHGSLGFLGGFAWTVLVAYICLYNLNSSVDHILHKFFVTFSNWDMRRPVRLTPLKEKDDLKLEPWNPLKRHSDSLHEWPILTPVYPSQNAAFSVIPHTFSIMKSLLAKAASVTEKILNRETSWAELFKPHISFFSHYKHFLLIGAWSTTSKVTFDWLGLLESQIRLLFISLSKCDGIKLIHPYTEKLAPVQPRCGNEMCWAAGLKVDKTGGNLNIMQEVQDFKTKVFALAKERGIYEEGMSFDIKYIKRSQLFELFQQEHLEKKSKEI